MVPKKNNDVETFVVEADEEGVRLDVFCASKYGSVSRNQIQKINRDGCIEVNGVVRPHHYALRGGDRVKIMRPQETQTVSPVAQDIPLRVVYEDEDLLVINKHAGIVVHPAHGHREGTVVNAVLGRNTRLAQLGGVDRPGVVHRLDKDTSGLLVMAKSEAAYRGLSQQIKARRFAKTYHAIVWGRFGVREQRIDAPISRHPVHRQKMAVVARGGREAITEVFVVDTYEYFDYIRVATVTGRTHQIRVHLAHVAHPILGDAVYGGRKSRRWSSSPRIRSRMMRLLKVMPRQALNASRLLFEHPVTGRWMSFRTALPEDMRIVLEMLHGED